MSPALEGEFLTTGLAGKPKGLHLFKDCALIRFNLLDISS